MSQWLDFSNNSNKFKQSYFRNFVDVSGDVLIRNEQSLKLYNNSQPTQAQFSISSSEYQVFNETDQTYYDISNNALIYLKDLTENVQDRFDYFNEKTKHIATDITITNSDTMIEFDALNKAVVIHSTLDVSSNIIGLYDLSINGNISANGDVSFNSDLYVNGSICTANNVIVPDVVRFDDNFAIIIKHGQEIRLDIDNFALIKPARDGIGSRDIIFENNFVLIQEGIEPFIFNNVDITDTLTVTSLAIFNGAVYVEAPVNGKNAANKAYVDNTVRSTSLAISLTTTGMTNEQIAMSYLSKIFPANEHSPNTICRVVCTDNGDITIRQFDLLSDIWTYMMNL